MVLISYPHGYRPSVICWAFCWKFVSQADSRYQASVLKEMSIAIDCKGFHVQFPRLSTEAVKFMRTESLGDACRSKTKNSCTIFADFIIQCGSWDSANRTVMEMDEGRALYNGRSRSLLVTGVLSVTALALVGEFSLWTRRHGARIPGRS